MCDETKPRIGNILKGQGWVELNGAFTRDELLALIVQINILYGDSTNDNQKRCNNTMGSKPTNHSD